MQARRYRIRDGILRFEDGVTVFEDYLQIPETVTSVDFNEVRHVLKPFSLMNTLIKEIDFKQVITVKGVHLPSGVKITENLYWADEIFSQGCIVEHSSRMKYLGIYDHRELVYLSGSVSGHLPLRTEQRDIIYNAGYGVYSPGNHITFGDPVADEYPSLVADFDLWALDKCRVIFLDLTNLSPGTCAELGYIIAKGWAKTKRVYYLYKGTSNFFINGLLRDLIKVSSIEEFLERDRQNYGFRRNAKITT